MLALTVFCVLEAIPNVMPPTLNSKSYHFFAWQFFGQSQGYIFVAMQESLFFRRPQMNKQIFRGMLFIALGVSTAAPSQATVLGEIRPFLCGSNNSYVRLVQHEGNGFGPTNLFAYVAHPANELRPRAGGYVFDVQDSSLKPPSGKKGFVQFSLVYYEGVTGAKARDFVMVDFHFQAADGKVTVVTKNFEDLNPGKIAPNTLSASGRDFDIPVIDMNLVKVIPYLATPFEKVDFYFGDVTINSGQGVYSISQVITRKAPCPQVDLPPPLN
ncbi:MAG: hypothetical protein K2X29_06210 [Candidatus Obscuribacterales bacterium]|nr:hypothetical protein [Candidatus Obscuribacterales bacterium]